MLKPRVRKFIKEYVKNGGNATKAAQLAGYGNGEHYSRTAGHRLITNDDILREIEVALEGAGLSSRFIARRLKRIIERPKEGDGIAVACINLVGKMRGYDVPKKQFQIPPMPVSQEELDELLKRARVTAR